MADLVITASAITPGTATGFSFNRNTSIAGETITAGQSVYIKAADSKAWLADSNASVDTAAAVGISLHAALAGQPIAYGTSGPLNFGAILLAGKWYVVSATAGGLAPIADLTTGWYSTVMFYGYSTSVGILMPTVTGIVCA